MQALSASSPSPSGEETKPTAPSTGPASATSATSVVSAAEALARAQEVEADLGASGVQGFAGEIEGEQVSAGKSYYAKWKVYIRRKAPNLLLTERHRVPPVDRITINTRDALGQESEWDISSQGVSLTDLHATKEEPTGPRNLGAVLADLGPGYAVRLMPGDTVVNRPTHVLELEPGSSPAEPRMERAQLWIDRETGILLKVLEEDASGSPIHTWAFTTLELNPTLDPNIFNFAVPPRVDVDYYRPPAPHELPALWVQTAGKAPFTLFRPLATPDWLEPRMGPLNISRDWIEIGYYPRRDVSDAGESGLVILQRPALGGVDPQAEVVPLEQGTGHYWESSGRRWLVVEQDGTEVWMQGQGKVTRDDLVKVAASLELVPEPPASPAIPPGVTPTVRQYGTGDFTFVDAQQGWHLAQSCADNTHCLPVVQATTDGGQTWELRGALPAPSGVSASPPRPTAGRSALACISRMMEDGPGRTWDASASSWRSTLALVCPGQWSTPARLHKAARQPCSSPLTVGRTGDLSRRNPL